MNTIFRTLLTPDTWPAFARGMLAYGAAEAATRVVRLGAILVVARQVSPATLGAAALALSLFELVRVLANAGIGQRIIIAADAELAGICRMAAWLFWALCSAVMLVQLGVAAVAWLAFDLADVAAMLAVLSFVYLFMPAGLVQIFLAMRDQRMAWTAKVAAAQNIADCALTVALVLAWPSAWALVLPKLLTAPIWLMLARRAFPWSPDRQARPAAISEFARFGPSVLASEVLSAARLHADKLVVGAVLGTEALGLYYFAFNAGLGITQSIVAACNLVLFPQLAKVGHQRLEAEFRKAFALGLAVLLPLVAVQVLLAPIYVPIIFGATWITAVPHLSILAGAAIPLFCAAIIGARYRALCQPYSETSLMAATTFAALLGLLCGAQFGLIEACIGFGAGLAAVQLPTAAALLMPTALQQTPAPQGDQ